MQTKSPKSESKEEINPLNSLLVDRMVTRKVINSQEVQDVLKSIDRGDFCIKDPYEDRPQSIGYKATISAPHMHAYALEYLKGHLKTAKRCLDVGSGSGYLTLAFAKMMEQADAVSYGIEHIPDLVKASIVNLQKNHQEYLEKGKVVLIEGDGRLGLKEYAPYEAIHVGAAASKIPQELIDQLAPGGRMLIPVGVGSQEFMVVDKDQSGEIVMKSLFGVGYIPLTSKEKQCPSL